MAQGPDVRDLGINGFLSKPVDLVNLLATVRRWVGMGTPR